MSVHAHALNGFTSKLVFDCMVAELVCIGKVQRMCVMFAGACCFFAGMFNLRKNFREEISQVNVLTHNNNNSTRTRFIAFALLALLQKKSTNSLSPFVCCSCFDAVALLLLLMLLLGGSWFWVIDGCQ